MSSRFLVSIKQMKNTSRAGFGLIELMVSISIMAIVASIILARQDSFNSAVLLRGQAYQMALAIREVQLSAVSASSDGSGGFRTVYGLYFNTADTHDGKYQVFKDAGNNYFYTTGSEAFGPTSNLDKRFEISAMRAVGGGNISGTELSIIFERPNFDARFFDAANSELSTASGVEIDIVRRGASGTGCGELRTVEVTRTGQIAVKDCP